MVRFVTPLVLASLSLTALAAQTCNSSKQCKDEKYPCCSQYGECGTGAYCLGGCDPLASFSLDSCAPMPVCVSKTYTWDNLDNSVTQDKYLGNATAADWTYSGKEVKTEDGNLIMTMPAKSVGTLFANNHYIWYGKVSGKFKSSRGKGVVTAFILLSDVKDEIDYEWVGADLTAVQTNYYWQGVLDWHNSGNISVEGEDTFNDWHTYEIDWTPEKVDWIVDGTVARTLKKADTYNETSKQYAFPQTPARLQMSLWPAGQSSNAQGTIDWAGGEIDWNSEDIKNVGYDYATVGEVSVKCYDPPSDSGKGTKAYVYTGAAAMEADIAITNNSTVLASLGATGLDMNLGAKSGSSTSKNSSSTSVSNSIPTIKGGSGGMTSNDSGDSSSSSDSSSDSSSGTSTTDNGETSTSTGFTQGATTQDSGAAGQNERVLRGSLFGVLVALVVLVTL